jgi:hypothetical protein
MCKEGHPRCKNNASFLPWLLHKRKQANGIKTASPFLGGGALLGSRGLQGLLAHHQVKALHKGRKAYVVGVKIASWNVGGLSKKLGEVVEVLRKRRVDVCCIQKARWKGEGARLIGRHDAKYKIY